MLNGNRRMVVKILASQVPGISSRVIRKAFSTIPMVIGAEAPKPGNTEVAIFGSSDRRGTAMTHYFDTFHIVTRLESAGFEHGQAVATMNAIRALLVNATEVAKADMLSRADLENVCRTPIFD